MYVILALDKKLSRKVEPNMRILNRFYFQGFYVFQLNK